MSDPTTKPEVTVFVCGGKAADACPAGGEHDDKGYVEFDNGTGASVACSKCGSTAFERDLLRLP